MNIKCFLGRHDRQLKAKLAVTVTQHSTKAKGIAKLYQCTRCGQEDALVVLPTRVVELNVGWLKEELEL